MNFQTVSILSLTAFIAMESAWHAPTAFCQESLGSHENKSANTSKKYELVWSDEFDQEGPPDPKNWTFEYGFERNEELQWYQPENASCENGKLVITAKRERVMNPFFVAGTKNWKKNRQHAEYTSACITTRGLHSWTFGRIEVRARIDARKGLWPAIWTVGESGNWPDAGEIDIMEYYQGKLLANACWSSGKRWKATWDSARIPLSDFGGATWATEFHTWRMDWDEERIELFVNDSLLNTIELSQTVGKHDNLSSPFHQPHYLLLNLAIGGTNGGDPSKTEFPATFEVDYVRVYQSTFDK
ncbi:glycoside hydrolase family 16 protein [Bythopirellula polymerisocia]|uniref:glycoside hydrolase family 16 protein n=1 Tax=Bythopirellula polymerisocia TaxID=2528003 RepID=UPI001E3E375C|nr:glycoside hydrolase family 16 protein [Bythopirellula polymerisocia]